MNKFESYISGEIKRGDLILILYGSTSHSIGLYDGEGINTSQRFYRIDKWINERLMNKKRVYRSYITGKYTKYRIIKLTPECLDDQLQKLYYETKKLLKENGYL